MARSRSGKRAGFGLLLAVGILTSSSGVRAQADPGSDTTTFFQSTSETLTFNPASVTTTSVTNYNTQIVGRLAGGAPLYDQTFNVAFADPAAQAGVASARMAITTAGGPGVIVGAPVRTASSSTSTSTSTSVYSLAGPGVSTDDTRITFGPNTIQVGALSTCAVGGLPSATRPTCTTGGTPRPVVTGETNFNTVTNTAYTINQATTTTNTTSVFEQYTLIGFVQAFGLAHTAVQSGALDAGSRFLRRIGDEASGTAETGMRALLMAEPGVVAGTTPRVRMWAEGYGVWSKSKADGGIPGDDRSQYGFAGGLSGNLTPNIMLGVGIDHGNTDIKLDSGFERADIRLTQLGLYAGYTAGPWFVNLAGTFGAGDAKTEHILGGVTRAAYDLTIAGVLGEAGYRMQWGPWRITPSVGFDYTYVRTDSFAETGPLALIVPAHSTDRTRVWFGLDVGQRNGAFDWSVYGRLVGLVSGDERLLPVAFAGLPMVVTGVSEAKIGGDAGARAAYKLSHRTELFARYDGRFRDGFTAHAATAGFKVSF